MERKNLYVRFSVLDTLWYDLPADELMEVWWALPNFRGIPLHTNRYELHARISLLTAYKLRGLPIDGMDIFEYDYTTVIIEDNRYGGYGQDYEDLYSRVSRFAGSRPTLERVVKMRCKDRITDLCRYRQFISLDNMERILLREGYCYSSIKHNIKQFIDENATDLSFIFLVKTFPKKKPKFEEKFIRLS